MAPKKDKKPEKKTTEKRPVGRPPEDIFEKYNIIPSRVEKIAALGATDAQFADLFGVGESTIQDWRKDNPEFSGAIKKGKDKADSAVVKSLYKRALGYAYNETVTEKCLVEQKDGEEVIFRPAKKIKTTRKHLASDPTSGIFWLKNRRPQEWRDIKHQQLGGSLGTSFASGLSAIDKTLESNPDLKAQLEDELVDK